MFLFKERVQQKDCSVFYRFNPLAETHESGLMFQTMSGENCSETLYYCLKMLVDAEPFVAF